jgi:hypothetical protein
MEDLMQKLALSKKIMDMQQNIPRGQAQGMPSEGNYNIPNEIIQEQQISQPQIPKTIQQPNSENVTPDRIKKSKLPDEIKQLMIEHPIQQPSFGNGNVLSNDIIEGAARLMNKGKEPIQETKSQRQPQGQSVPDINSLKQMIRDTVRDTVRDVVREELQNSGMITESTSNTNETLSLRVGKHIFEGKVLKIKKIK